MAAKLATVFLDYLAPPLLRQVKFRPLQLLLLLAKYQYNHIKLFVLHCIDHHEWTV